jgi:hypothetical protein
MLAAAQRGLTGITPQTSPAVWPTLPLLPALGILLALAPAWLAPMPPLRALERAAGPQSSRERGIEAKDIHNQRLGRPS